MKLYWRARKVLAQIVDQGRDGVLDYHDSNNRRWRLSRSVEKVQDVVEKRRSKHLDTHNVEVLEEEIL